MCHVYDAIHDVNISLIKHYYNNSFTVRNTKSSFHLIIHIIVIIIIAFLFFPLRS